MVKHSACEHRRQVYRTSERNKADYIYYHRKGRNGYGSEKEHTSDCRSEGIRTWHHHEKSPQ